MMTRQTKNNRKKRELAKLDAVREQAFREGYQQAEKDTKATAAIPEYSKASEIFGEAVRSDAGLAIQKFTSGATRDLSDDKPDYEGFLSPEVIEAFGAYMHANRTTATGQRGSDNWQAGIPMDVYMKSLWRHFHAVWKLHREKAKFGGRPLSASTMLVELMAVMFNVQGYAHELIKQDLGNAGLAAFPSAAKRARDLDLEKRRKIVDRAEDPT